MKEYIITFEDDDWFFEYAQTRYTHFFGCPIEEIVRCRDCEKASFDEFGGGWCCENCREIKLLNYCAWAERREP